MWTARLVLLFVLAAPALAQTPTLPAPPAPPPAPCAAPPISPVGTSRELLIAVIRPASDALFYIETRPPQDGNQWTALQRQALMLAEAANLLVLPGRARETRSRWQTHC